MLGRQQRKSSGYSAWQEPASRTAAPSERNLCSPTQWERAIAAKLGGVDASSLTNFDREEKPVPPNSLAALGRSIVGDQAESLPQQWAAKGLQVSLLNDGVVIEAASVGATLTVSFKPVTVKIAADRNLAIAMIGLGILLSEQDRTELSPAWKRVFEACEKGLPQPTPQEKLAVMKILRAFEANAKTQSINQKLTQGLNNAATEQTQEGRDYVRNLAEYQTRGDKALLLREEQERAIAALFADKQPTFKQIRTQIIAATAGKNTTLIEVGDYSLRVEAGVIWFKTGQMSSRFLDADGYFTNAFHPDYYNQALTILEQLSQEPSPYQEALRSLFRELDQVKLPHPELPSEDNAITAAEKLGLVCKMESTSKPANQLPIELINQTPLLFSGKFSEVRLRKNIEPKSPTQTSANVPYDFIWIGLPKNRIGVLFYNFATREFHTTFGIDDAYLALLCDEIAASSVPLWVKELIKQKRPATTKPLKPIPEQYVGRMTEAQIEMYYASGGRIAVSH